MSDHTEPIVYVYLAGPITGLTYDEAVDRREELAKPLREAKGVRIVPLSPMRGKKNLARNPGVLKPGGYRSPASTDAAIVGRDYNDVMRSYIIVADLLGCTEKSIGTCVEFGVCLAHRKFVVTIMEKDENPHDHGFIHEISNVIVHTRKEAVKVVLDVIGAEEPDEEEEDDA